MESQPKQDLNRNNSLTKRPHENIRKTQRKTEHKEQEERLTETKNKFNLLKDEVPEITAQEISPLQENKPEAVGLDIE